MKIIIRNILVLCFWACCLVLNAQPTSKSVIEFRTKVIKHTDPQVVLKNGNLTAIYSFINRGIKPVKILDVHPSCSCTTPDYSKNVIQSGGKGTITLSTKLKQLENNGMVYAVIKTDSEADTYIKLELKF